MILSDDNFVSLVFYKNTSLDKALITSLLQKLEEFEFIRPNDKCKIKNYIKGKCPARNSARECLDQEVCSIDAVKLETDLIETNLHELLNDEQFNPLSIEQQEQQQKDIEICRNVNKPLLEKITTEIEELKKNKLVLKELSGEEEKKDYLEFVNNIYELAELVKNPEASQGGGGFSDRLGQIFSKLAVTKQAAISSLRLVIHLICGGAVTFVALTHLLLLLGIAFSMAVIMPLLIYIGIGITCAATSCEFFIEYLWTAETMAWEFIGENESVYDRVNRKDNQKMYVRNNDDLPVLSTFPPPKKPMMMKRNNKIYSHNANEKPKIYSEYANNKPIYTKGNAMRKGAKQTLDPIGMRVDGKGTKETEEILSRTLVRLDVTPIKTHYLLLNDILCPFNIMINFSDKDAIITFLEGGGPSDVFNIQTIKFTIKDDMLKLNSMYKYRDKPLTFLAKCFGRISSRPMYCRIKKINRNIEAQKDLFLHVCINDVTDIKIYKNNTNSTSSPYRVEVENMYVKKIEIKPLHEGGRKKIVKSNKKYVATNKTIIWPLKSNNNKASKYPSRKRKIWINVKNKNEYVRIHKSDAIGTSYVYKKVD